MKIYGPNHTNFNPYKDLIQKQKNTKSSVNGSDQLQISNEAQKLHEHKQPEGVRRTRIEEIKASIESGSYEINYEKTAKKMIEFWTKHR